MSLTTAADDAIRPDLDAALRERVRREGLDPQRDVAAVRRLATRVVREHDERSLTGVVLPVADPDAVVESLVADLAGFGPLQPYLEDPEVEEIWINDPYLVRYRYPQQHEHAERNTFGDLRAHFFRQ